MADNGPESNQPAQPRTLLLRDLIDGQLRTREGRRIGRVADVELEWNARGVYVRRLVLGPEAHLGRVLARFGSVAERILKGRFEHAIDVGAVEEIGPNVMLRDTSDAYDTG